MAEKENLLLVGMTIAQVQNSLAWYNPLCHCRNEPEAMAALDLIFSDYFSRNEPGAFGSIGDTGKFSSDHTIHEYGTGIWKAELCPIR